MVSSVFGLSPDKLVIYFEFFCVRFLFCFYIRWREREMYMYENIYTDVWNESVGDS